MKKLPCAQDNCRPQDNYRPRDPLMMISKFAGFW
jgi:hypothetical protein